MKAWYTSKTVWIGVLEIVIGALGLIATFLGKGIYTPEAIVFLVVGILTIILRYFTSTAIA